MKKIVPLQFSAFLSVCSFFVMLFSPLTSNAEFKELAKTSNHIIAKKVENDFAKISRNFDINKIKLIESFKTLSNFGKKLDTVKKPSKKDISLLSKYSKIPLPSPIFIVKNVVFVSGINVKTNKAVVLNSITGEEADGCKIGKGASKDHCQTQLIAPSDAVKAALNINKPIKGEIIKNGKRIPATYTVRVTATYKGSHCNTEKTSTGQYEQCNTWP